MSRDSIISNSIDPLQLRVACGRLNAAQLTDITAKIDASIAALRDRSGISIPALRILTEKNMVEDWTLEALDIPLGGGTLDQIADAQNLPATVVDLLRRNTKIFLGLQEVTDILNELGSSYPEVVKEAVRAAPTMKIAEVFRILAEEQVQLRNLRGIVEAIAKAGQFESNAFHIAEHVRVAIRRNIIAPLRAKGRLRVLMIDAELEEILRQTLTEVSDIGFMLAIKPKQMRLLIQQLEERAKASGAHAILTAQDVRRPLRRITEADLFEVPVLSFNELDPSIPLDIVAELGFPLISEEQEVILDDKLDAQPNTTFDTPSQESAAISYGVNEQGKLDRLSRADQIHLRDTPEQRRAYADLRKLVGDLLAEGQRLGKWLERELARFSASLPEQFENALTYEVWFNANSLRSLNYANGEAQKSLEPDEAKLEPVIGAKLDGMLKHYNVMAFGDGSLRAKDEQSIAPQEQADAEAEAAAAKPLLQALRDMPNIATDIVHEDLATEQERADLPVAIPYQDQTVDQLKRTWRNRVAGLVGDTWLAFKDSNIIAQGLTVNAVWDGTKVSGSLIATTIAGIEYAPVLEFIATNAQILQNYVAIAFPNYEHLPELIERMRIFWKSVASKRPN